MADVPLAHDSPFNNNGPTDGAALVNVIQARISALEATVELLAHKQVANGYAGLDQNGDVIGAATLADVNAGDAFLQAQIDAIVNGGGGGGGGSQVVPMGMYSGSDATWDRTIAMVNDPRWTIPLRRWFSSGFDDTLATAKSEIDSVSATLLINLPSKFGGNLVAWSAVTAGTYDTQINAWATALATFTCPSIYITFVDEPDGTDNGQGQSASSYFSAFDHVKTILQSHVPGAKVGLSLAVASRMPTWTHNAYDFIDWNPYNRNSPWLSFAAIMQRDYATMAVPGKPLIVTTGSVENPNDPSGPNSKKQWYVNMGNTLLTAHSLYPLLSQVYIWDRDVFAVDTSAAAENGFITLVQTDFTSSLPPTGITVDQTFTPGISTSSGTTVALTVGTAVAAGKHVIVLVRGNGNPNTCTIADSRGNTYQNDSVAGIVLQNIGAAKSFISIYSSKLATGLQIGDTITATLGAAVTTKDICGIAVSGLNATTWLDKNTGTTATSTNPDSGGTATTAGAALIVGGAVLALPLALDSLDDANGHAMNVIDDQQIGTSNNRGVAAGWAMAPAAEGAHYVANSHGNSGAWAALVAAYKA